ncbi:hypothetical protein [Sphingomonas sp. GV3]|uniref:hypothetical protein n=1 Tax=Sphingomonas sp. GV3 TaxID=3040671 RepID=UPI00280C3D85|nr:hypothetical protein [Sphingomonas sp. GV3]
MPKRFFSFADMLRSSLLGTEVGKPHSNDGFERDAVGQITEGGYLVAQVPQQLLVAPQSSYVWKRQPA